VDTKRPFIASRSARASGSTRWAKVTIAFTLSILRRVDECRPAFPTTNILSHSKRSNDGSLRATTSLRASDITADLAAAGHLLSRPTTTCIIGGLVPSRPCEAGPRRLLALLGQFGRRSKSSGSRGEADVQRTCSDLPRLTQSGRRTIRACPVRNCLPAGGDDITASRPSSHRCLGRRGRAAQSGMPTARARRGGEGFAPPVYAIDRPLQISLGGFPRVRSRRH
jgi:hypothetical protein